jgi:hypothetical protein
MNSMGLLLSFMPINLVILPGAFHQAVIWVVVSVVQEMEGSALVIAAIMSLLTVQGVLLAMSVVLMVVFEEMIVDFVLIRTVTIIARFSGGPLAQQVVLASTNASMNSVLVMIRLAAPLKLNSFLNIQIKKGNSAIKLSLQVSYIFNVKCTQSELKQS